MVVIHVHWIFWAMACSKLAQKNNMRRSNSRYTTKIKKNSAEEIVSREHHSTLMFPTVTVITFQCYGIGLCNVRPVTICYILHFLVTQIKRFGRYCHFLWLIFGNWIFWLLRNWVFCCLIYTTVLKIILHNFWKEFTFKRELGREKVLDYNI